MDIASVIIFFLATALKMQLQLFHLAIRISSTIETWRFFFLVNQAVFLILEPAALNSLAVKTDIFHFLAI